MRAWDKIKTRLYSLKNLTAVSSADIFGVAVSSVFWLYIATSLEPEKFGEIQYFIGIATLGSGFALIGSQTVMTVYTAKNVKIQSTLSFISFIAGFVSSLVIILIFFRIDAGFAVFGFIVNTLSLGYIIGKKEFVLSFKYTITQKILLVVLGIGFYFIFGADGIIYALALSYASYSLIIYRVFKESKINFSLLKPRFTFIANNYALFVTAIFGKQIDRLLIVPLLGYGVLGNYTLAIQLISIFHIMPAILLKYLLPHDSTNIENHKLKKYSILLSIGLFFLILFLAPLTIPHVFPKYENVIEITQIMSITIVAGTINAIYSSKFFGAEISKYNFIAVICATVTIIVGIIILGPIYGIYGISIAFALSSIAHCSCLVICDKIPKKEKRDV